MKKLTDAEIVSGILHGREKSLRYFYRLYSAKLLKFISRKTQSHQDAEEILQDVLLSSLEAMRDFTFRSSLSTFIHSIAKHKIVDYYRKKKIVKIFLSQSPKLEAIISTLTGPEELYQQKELKDKIRSTLIKLTPVYRRILTMKYFEQKSVREIKEELKVSFKSAESMLFRARRSFIHLYKIT